MAVRVALLRRECNLGQLVIEKGYYDYENDLNQFEVLRCMLSKLSQMNLKQHVYFLL